MSFGIAAALIHGNALYDQFTTRRLSDFEIEEKFDYLVKGLLDEEEIHNVKDFVKQIGRKAQLTDLI